ncbi:hypothetical protein PS947_03310 [Pseudomonas fluorescens]|nr:hypothetical protein PS947_03310 [Pseudomonas fluorescens]
MLGDQPVLAVVLEGQRVLLAVVDANQTAETVVLVGDLEAVGQGLDQQTPGSIALIRSEQTRAVIAELGLLQQMAVEVIGVRRAPAVKTAFLTNQPGRCVIQPVLFPRFVFNLGEQQLRMVVAVLHPCAIGVDPPRDQVQVIVVFVAGDVPELIALGSDLTVGAVAVGAGRTVRKCRLNQSADGVPMLPGDRTVFVRGCGPSPQRIVGKTPHAAVGQGFLGQLAEGIPDQAMAAAVRIADRQQLTPGVVVVMGDLAVGVDRFGDITLGIAPVDPHRVTARAFMQEAVAILVGRGRLVRRNQRHQPSDLVVAVFGDRAQGILLGNQATRRVIGLELLATVGLDLAHQPRTLVVDVNLFGAIDVMHRDAAVVIPDVTGVHLRKRRPVTHATCGFPRPLPLPEKTRAAGQLPLQNHVRVVVVVTLAFTDGIAGFDQVLIGVVAVTDQRLFGAPDTLAKHLVIDTQQLRAVIAQQQRAPGAVIQALHPVRSIALHRQTIAIGIADRRQPSCTKVIKPRRFPGQCEDQLFRFIAQENRRPRQAVVNRRSLNTRQRKAGAPVLVIDPNNLISEKFQPMRQRMTPAKPQPDIDLSGTRAIQPRELKRQHAIKHPISQGQQFFASDHRHRAAVGTGARHAIGAVTVGIFRLIRRVVMRLMSLDPARTARLVPHNRRRIRHRQHHRISLTNVQRYRRCRFQLNVTHIEHQRLQNAGMPRQIRRGRQFGQAQSRGRQPFPRPWRLDLRQHLAAQAQRHADATRQSHQQKTDQQFDPHLGHHFGQVLRRQHLQPTGKRGHMNEQQRFVTEDQQAVGNGVAGGIQ